jgi:hypothetical protein
MLGFLLADNAEVYHGFDVAQETRKGVLRMYEDLKGFATVDKFAQLDLCPFEDARAKGLLEESSYDFALTSPPYFDVEKYEGDDTSTTRYPTFEEWVFGFYTPLISNVFYALKPGAVFALNVSSHSYPLTMRGISIAKQVGFQYVENRRSARMVAATEDDDDGSVIIILKKPK